MPKTAIAQIAVIVMLRMLILQSIYNLSDEQAECSGWRPHKGGARPQRPGRGAGRTTSSRGRWKLPRESAAAEARACLRSA